MEIVPLLWKFRNIKFLCHTHKAGSNISRLWGITALRSFQKYPSIKIILGSLSYRRFKTSSRNSKGNPHKEKIDKQLVGQSSYTPFMNIQDGYHSGKKAVSFNPQDWLDDKLDKITFMMSKLTAESSSQNRPFNSKIYQGTRRRQARNYYNQVRYQNKYRSDSGDRKMSYRDRGQYRQNYRRSH